MDMCAPCLEVGAGLKRIVGQSGLRPSDLKTSIVQPNCWTDGYVKRGGDTVGESIPEGLRENCGAILDNKGRFIK